MASRSPPLPPLDIKARLTAINRATLVGKRDDALLIVGLQTRRRLSELAKMCFGDMTLSGECMTVVWCRCKGGKAMSDALPPAVTRGGGVSTSAVRRRTIKGWDVARRAGLGELRADNPHTDRLDTPVGL